VRPAHFSADGLRILWKDAVMWFATFIFANLVGRPARSLLTLSGVAVAVAAVVSLTGIVRGFENSLLDLYRHQGVDLIVHQTGKVQMTDSRLRQTIGAEIQEIPGVQAVYPSLLEVISLADDDYTGVTIQGWPVGSVALEELDIVRGRLFDGTQPRPIVIGNRLAEVLRIGPGDTLDLLEDEPFTVTGVFDSYNVFESGSVVARLADLQELMLMEGTITMFAIVLSDKDDQSIAAVRQTIMDRVPGVAVNPVRELAEQSSEIQMARGFAWVTSTIALLIGSIGMLNTLMMAVFERTREIAMLRALGWRRRRIVGLILGEATILCVGGAVLGIVIAILGVWWLSQMPSAGRMVSGDLSWDVILQGFVIAILLGLIGGAYPAWVAARMTPVEGLRHD
jgi:putative ABC transport system permease protein